MLTRGQAERSSDDAPADGQVTGHRSFPHQLLVRVDDLSCPFRASVSFIFEAYRPAEASGEQSQHRHPLSFRSSPGDMRQHCRLVVVVQPRYLTQYLLDITGPYLGFTVDLVFGSYRSSDDCPSVLDETSGRTGIMLDFGLCEIRHSLDDILDSLDSREGVLALHYIRRSGRSDAEEPVLDVRLETGGRDESACREVRVEQDVQEVKLVRREC